MDKNTLGQSSYSEKEDSGAMFVVALWAENLRERQKVNTCEIRKIPFKMQIAAG